MSTSIIYNQTRHDASLQTTHDTNIATCKLRTAQTHDTNSASCGYGP